MIIHADKLPEQVCSRVGPIIIGSGPVGLALARFLANRHVPSLVIEAGAETTSHDGNFDLTPEYAAARMEGAVVGRTRQIGGGLNLWGGQIAQLDPKELEPTGDASGGWPFPIEELAPYYITAATLLGHDPPLRLPTDIFKEADISQLAAVGLDLLVTMWLKQPKLSPAMWRELERSPLTVVAHGAFVDRIQVDATSGRVLGISAVMADRQRIALRGSCVVLACGAIETSRLLLQPRSDGGLQAWAGLHWLGRGFNEHLDAAVANVTPTNARRLLDLLDPIVIKGIKFTPKLFTQIEVSEKSHLSAVAMLTMPGNVRNSIAELRLLLRGLAPRGDGRLSHRIAATAARSMREIAPLAWRYIRHKRLGTVFRGAGTLRVSTEQPVRAQSYISLSSTFRDSRGVPQAKLHWLKGEEEGQAFLGVAQKVRHWAMSAGLAHVDIDPLLIKDPARFAAAADDGLHQAGGARMSDNPAFGVVDSNLQVFNAPGLFCCGTATFPRSGVANPTWTAVALGVRLGEHLMETGLAAA